MSNKTLIVAAVFFGLGYYLHGHPIKLPPPSSSTLGTPVPKPADYKDYLDKIRRIKPFDRK